MNTQTALKRCFDYFLDENHKPGYRDDNCVYYANGNDPVRCAIGCLLPKELEAKAGMVMGGLNSLYRAVPEVRQLFADANNQTLRAMQNVHDGWALPGAWVGNEYNCERETFLDYLQTLLCYHEEK